MIEERIGDEASSAPAALAPLTTPAIATDSSPLESAPPSSGPDLLPSDDALPSELAAGVDFGSLWSDVPLLALALACAIALVVAGFFSALSASLLRALPTADVEPDDDDAEHDGGGHPDRSERFAASASVAAYVWRTLAVAAGFVLCFRMVAGDGAGSPGWTLFLTLAVTAVFGGPLLHLATQSVPLAIAHTHGERLVTFALPTFAATQAPLGWAVSVLAGLRRVVLRAVRTPDADYGTRRLVEGFRAMVEGAEFEGELGDETRELIANVIEFGAADAAEVMTPRTEIKAVDRDASLKDAIGVFAASGFSRIPVYVDTVDTIIGTLTALEAAKAVAEGRTETTAIADVMRPPLLVPETQPVPELLSAFRAERQKMAIVVDEYGGTAGLVTLADVMAEIVGHVQDEFEPEDRSFVRMDAEHIEADAGLHVSEVNEELDLSLPEEEDYETLAGFVLTEFGRFPSTGETFAHDGVSFTVAEASDRRVMRVVLQRAGGLVMARDEKANEHVGRRPALTREGRGTTIALRPDHAKKRRGPLPAPGASDDERRRA